MINTNNIISSIEENLEKSINLQQQQLNNIKDAFSKAQNFLLENDYSELSEENDVIVEIMNCLKKIKGQISSNNKDIDNIKESIKSLGSLSNVIDKSIINQLEDKIKLIKGSNDASSEKLNESKAFLDVLLTLEILCPACNGSAKANGRCSYCDNIGVVNISKVLEKNNLIDADFVQPIKNTYVNNSLNTNNYEDINPFKENLNEHKFVISRTN